MSAVYFLTNAHTNAFNRITRRGARGRSSRNLTFGTKKIGPGQTIQISRPEVLKANYPQLQEQAKKGMVQLVCLMILGGGRRLRRSVNVANTAFEDLPHLKVGQEDKPQEPKPEPKLEVVKPETQEPEEQEVEDTPPEPEEQADEERLGEEQPEHEEGVDPEEAGRDEPEWPSKSDLHAAKKDELVELANAIELKVDGDLKEDYKRALLEHFYPADYDY